MRNVLGVLAAAGLAVASQTSSAVVLPRALAVFWPDSDIPCGMSTDVLIWLEFDRGSIWGVDARVPLELFAYDNDPATPDQLLGEGFVFVPASNTESRIFGQAFIRIDCVQSGVRCLPAGNLATYAPGDASLGGLTVRLGGEVLDSEDQPIDVVARNSLNNNEPGGVCASPDIRFEIGPLAEVPYFDPTGGLVTRVQIPETSPLATSFGLLLDLNGLEGDIVSARLEPDIGPVQVTAVSDERIALSFDSDGEAIPLRSFDLILGYRRTAGADGFGEIRFLPGPSGAFFAADGTEIPFAGFDRPVLEIEPANEPAVINTDFVHFEPGSDADQPLFRGNLIGDIGAIEAQTSLLSANPVVSSFGRLAFNPQPKPPAIFPSPQAGPILAAGEAVANRDGSFSIPLFSAQPLPPNILFQIDLRDPFGDGSTTQTILADTYCPADANGDLEANIFDLLLRIDELEQGCQFE